jgi:hypothetical protein
MTTFFQNCHAIQPSPIILIEKASAQSFSKSQRFTGVLTTMPVVEMEQLSG